MSNPAQLLEVPDPELEELERVDDLPAAQPELPFTDSNLGYDRSVGFDIVANEHQPIVNAEAKTTVDKVDEPFDFEREFQEDLLTGEMKLGEGGFPFTGEYPETKDPTKQMGIYMDIDMDLRYILEGFGRARNRLTTVQYLIMSKDKEIYYWKMKYCQAAGLPKPKAEYEFHNKHLQPPLGKDSVMIVGTENAQNWIKAAIIVFFAGVFFAVAMFFYMVFR